MGRDKALVAVGGRPMVLAAVEALAAAGAADVVVVGGDPGPLAALGLRVVPDEHPGEGPLGGLVTALAAASEELVVVLACDLPGASAAAVTDVVAALGDAPHAAWAAPVVDGRRQLLFAAYRRSSAAHWADAFAAGERSLRRPADAIAGVVVPGVDPAALLDVDRPEDLPRRDG